MIIDIILMWVALLGFEDNKPKYDLHPQKTTFKMNDTLIILILMLIGCIFFIGVFFLIGSCTESGLYYNSNLY